MTDDASRNPPPSSTGDGVCNTRIKTVLAVYLFGISVLLVVLAAQLWPGHVMFKEASRAYDARFLVPRFAITDEVRLIVLVAIFGALGSTVHALRSFNWHVVRAGEWGRIWLLRYILQPPTGMAIALVFYAIVRAGFYSPGNDGGSIAVPWGAAALAALVGMFKEQATSKLKDVAEAVLRKPRSKTDDASKAGDRKEPPTAGGETRNEK